MDYKSVKKTIIDKLKKELPEHLTYHSVSHVQDVMKAAEKIALSEKVNDEEMILIKTAALFHDTGFLFNPKDHEQKSCEIAMEYLPAYGYSEDQIHKIKGMIMATKIPQSPKNKLEEIIADADLDYLGRSDFFSIGDTLYQELKHFGVINNELDWNVLQEKFLQNHVYFTPTSIKKRTKKKLENLTLVKSKLN